MTRLAPSIIVDSLVIAVSVLAIACHSGEAPRTSVSIQGTPEPRATSGRTIVLGIDALGPDLLDQVLETADLPTFRMLVANGALARVDVTATSLPPLSPRIWATLATGQPPSIHGIEDWAFLDGETMRLYESTDRRAPALWNIASALGKRVGVVNWLTSYPAEVVDGFVISDRYNAHWAAKEADFANAVFDSSRDRAVYPRSLIRHLGHVRDPIVDHVPSPNAYEAIDREIFRLAFAALETTPVDLLLIYTRSFDEQCHTTWHSHDPPPGSEPGRYDKVVDFLERYDWMLAELVAHLGEHDHLVILSDHGFERGPGNGGPEGRHHSAKTATSLFLAMGPRIRRGAQIGSVSVLDILPTILELAGLPSARSLPGTIIRPAFRAESPNFVHPVESYQQQWRGGTSTFSTDREQADPALVERLRALGYLQETPKGRPARVGDTRNPKNREPQ